MSVREVQQYSMQVKSFRLVSVDGPEVFVRQWLPEGLIRAAIIIAHGAAEHGARYQRVAAFFAAQGYAVYAPDHRGHGHGMRLLAETLERIDAEGHPAYLESTNPANNARYEGVGFEARGSFEGYTPGSAVTTMWRPARR